MSSTVCQHIHSREKENRRCSAYCDISKLEHYAGEQTDEDSYKVLAIAERTTTKALLSSMRITCLWTVNTSMQSWAPPALDQDRAQGRASGDVVAEVTMNDVAITYAHFCGTV